jgi:hypothetical protein
VQAVSDRDPSRDDFVIRKKGVFVKIKWTNISIIIILAIGLIISCLMYKYPQSITILWSIILVLITSLYAYATFKILEIQKESEILKYFVQINLKSVKTDWIDNHIDKIELEFLNVSNGIGYNAKLKIFNGDSIVKIKDKFGIILDKNVGILQPNFSNYLQLDLSETIIVNKKCTLRLELKLLNPLKIENTFYYFIYFNVSKYGILHPEWDLISFDNGINKVNLGHIRDLSIV